MTTETTTREAGQDFIRDIVRDDLAAGRHTGIVTRFPPEPNGYLHIGHAKSICLNFGVAEEFGGRCNLRFDDTNPVKEEQEYIDAIKRDVHWLGFDWGEHLYHASDYFEQLYEWAEELIQAGKAYVDDQSAGGDARDPRHADRGRARTARSATARSRRTSTCSAACAPASSRTAPACCAPRSTWRRATSTCAIRCSTASCTPPIRAPATQWCIYPTYDFAHGQSDAIEGITHSLCTLEFEDHRPLYDWLLDNLPVPSRPRQTSSPGSTSTTPCCPSGVLTSWCATATSRAGTIRACRPSPACAGAACRRRRSATSPRPSAWRGPTAASTSPCSTTAVREALNRTAPRRMARAAAAQGGDRELSGRPDRSARRGQQPGGPGRRHAAR